MTVIHISMYGLFRLYRLTRASIPPGEASIAEKESMLWEPFHGNAIQVESESPSLHLRIMSPWQNRVVASRFSKVKGEEGITMPNSRDCIQHACKMQKKVKKGRECELGMNGRVDE